jgi:hypothetical protein
MHKGLIEYDVANHTYVITPKGTEVLRLSREVAGNLEPIDQMIKKYSYYMQDADYQEHTSGINSDKPAVHHAQ